MMSPIIPIIKPVVTMTFCLINPVASARALGGVEIGKIMATDELIATPISKVPIPPNSTNWAPILDPAIARIGTNNAAVAVWEIKFAIR